jgi:hypothetical protein
LAKELRLVTRPRKRGLWNVPNSIWLPKQTTGCSAKFIGNTPTHDSKSQRGPKRRKKKKTKARERV